jgi:DNA-binding LacI/PurR family transcriptional regulator
MLLLQEEHPELPRLPVHWNVWNDGEIEALKAWIKNNQPDVIVSYNEIVSALKEAGVKIPDEVGFASLFLNENETHLSGVHQNDRLIGQRAVDMVIDMLHRGETGIPETPVRMLVEGKWYPGETLPDRIAANTALTRPAKENKPAKAKAVRKAQSRKTAGALA